MKYGEGNNKPHALTSMTGTLPSYLPTANLTVTYSDFKKIATLKEGLNEYALTYGVDDQRRKAEFKENGVTKQTRYYVGDYEEEIDALGNIRKIHYLSGAIMVQENGTDKLYYTYSDNQGSLLALTNASGTEVERYAYDPWGARRNPDNWTLKDTRTTWTTNRGYTGHEHLDAFGIINMNGRVYDPLTAQFFSPDPYVQAPGNWLNYNRYSYCYNNPFKYTDPSGEFIITAMVAGAIINLAIQTMSGNVHSLGDAGIAAGIGALAGGAGAWAGSAASAAIGTSVGIGAANGAIVGAAGGAAGGFVGGAGNAWMGGASFESGLNTGLKSGLIGGLSGGLIGGAYGGYNANRLGADIWSGKVSGVPTNFDGMLAATNGGGGGETALYGGSLKGVTVSAPRLIGGHTTAWWANASGAIQQVNIEFAMFAGARLYSNSNLTVYRAFGGDSRVDGYSWTTENPNSVINYRDAAGLPSGGVSGSNNTAEFVVEGKTNIYSIMKIKSADPLDGNVGGLQELIINPRNVKLRNFYILKP